MKKRVFICIALVTVMITGVVLAVIIHAGNSFEVKDVTVISTACDCRDWFDILQGVPSLQTGMLYDSINRSDAPREASVVVMGETYTGKYSESREYRDQELNYDRYYVEDSCVDFELNYDGTLAGIYSLADEKKEKVYSFSSEKDLRDIADSVAKDYIDLGSYQTCVVSQVERSGITSGVPYIELSREEGYYIPKEHERVSYSVVYNCKAGEINTAEQFSVGIAENGICFISCIQLGTYSAEKRLPKYQMKDVEQEVKKFVESHLVDGVSVTEYQMNEVTLSRTKEGKACFYVEATLPYRYQEKDGEYALHIYLNIE